MYLNSKMLSYTPTMFSFQKLEVRKAALERTNALSDEPKVKQREVLVASFMSSEESGEEDGDTQQYLYIKALPWRDSKVNKFKYG